MEITLQIPVFEITTPPLVPQLPTPRLANIGFYLPVWFANGFPNFQHRPIRSNITLFHVGNTWNRIAELLKSFCVWFNSFAYNLLHHSKYVKSIKIGAWHILLNQKISNANITLACIFTKKKSRFLRNWETAVTILYIRCCILNRQCMSML